MTVAIQRSVLGIGNRTLGFVAKLGLNFGTPDILHLAGSVAAASVGVLGVSNSEFLSIQILFSLLAGLSIVEFLLYYRFKKIALKLGLPVSHIPFDYGVSAVVRQIYRRDRAMFVGMDSRPIQSRRSLAAAFDYLVKTAYTLVPAERIEITVSDGEQEYPQTAFIRGAAIERAPILDGSSLNLKQEDIAAAISLAGVRLGTITATFGKGYKLTKADRILMDILAHQAMVAIVNTQYSHKLLTIRRNSEQLQQAQTGFLANLSHEVRGPIGFLLNATELLEDGLYGEMNPNQLELLQMMKRSGDHMLDLMNDVLDFAKSESGKMSVDTVHSDVNELLKDMVGVVRKDAEEKGHKLVMIPHQDSPTCVCDRRHLRQILINLLTNAVKYTPNRGKIEIWADRVPDNKIRLHVRDSGVGIPEDDRSRVFTAFDRLDHAYSKAQAGSGIGMSLVKRLVEMNKGEIDFESEVGQGTHFWVVFPEKQEGVPDSPVFTEDQIQLDGQGKSIIFFSEDRGERSVINRYLSHIGFRVCDVASAQGAEFILDREPIKLAVINGSLVNPEVEQLLRLLRVGAGGDAIPVITLSNEAMRWEVKKYLRAGVDRYLAKPLSLEQLGLACTKMVNETYIGEVIPRALLQKNIEGLDPLNSEAARTSKASRLPRSSSDIEPEEVIPLDLEGEFYVDY